MKRITREVAGRKEDGGFSPPSSSILPPFIRTFPSPREKITHRHQKPSRYREESRFPAKFNVSPVCVGQIRPFLQGVRVVLRIGSTQSTGAIRAEHRIGLWDREISHHRPIFRLLLYKAGGLKAFFKVSPFILST